jgi:hypothetical protein
MGLKMSTRFTYLLLLKLPRNTTNNAVWLSSLHGVVFVSANRHKENKRMKVRDNFKRKLIELILSGAIQSRNAMDAVGGKLYR